MLAVGASLVELESRAILEGKRRSKSSDSTLPSLALRHVGTVSTMAQSQSAAAKEALAKATRVTRVLKKGLFAKDRELPPRLAPRELPAHPPSPAVAPMMYGFGDDQPAPDTVSVMEELLIEHITDVVRPPSVLPPSSDLSRSAPKHTASRLIAARSKWTTSSLRFGKTRRSSPESRNCYS